jgi:methyl-accepting chemotaxis protein
VLDQSTQQNAAMVEESSAATRNLRQQAERLTELVAVFRTG